MGEGPAYLGSCPKIRQLPSVCASLAVKKPSRRQKGKEEEDEVTPTQFGGVVTADHIVNWHEHGNPVHAH